MSATPKGWMFGLVVAAVLCAPPLAGVAAAQDDEFRRGLDAIDDKNWAAAASFMQQAIDKRPRESADRVRRGFERLSPAAGTEYLPYYFRGYALFQANDCAGAVVAWAASEQQRVVNTRPAFWKVLQDGYAECEKRGVLPPARFDPAVTTAVQQLNDINALARTVATLGERHPEIWSGDTAMRDQYNRAVAEITSASKSYGNARISRAQRDFAEASAAVARARTVLLSVEAGLNAAVDNQRSAQALIREVGEAIAAAEGLDRAIEAKKVPFTPQLTAAYEEGRAAIGRARERLAEGARTLNAPALASARTSAVDASSRLRQVLDGVTKIEQDEVRRQVGEAVTRAADAFSLLDNAVATLDRFVAQRPGVLAEDKEAERAALQKQVALARRRFDAARRAENAAAVADAAQLAAEARDRLNLLIATFGPLTLRDRGVHEVLERGAALFFEGRYQQAAATLEAAEAFAPDVPLRLHVHLFRAAAFYELSLRSSEADAGLREQALAEVAHSKAIDSAFQPDATAFSPRFRAFYQQAGTAPPAAVPAVAGAAPSPR